MDVTCNHVTIDGHQEFFVDSDNIFDAAETRKEIVNGYQTATKLLSSSRHLPRTKNRRCFTSAFGLPYCRPYIGVQVSSMAPRTAPRAQPTIASNSHARTHLLRT